MDSITHVLSAALWTEPVGTPRWAPGNERGEIAAAYARWRERMAVGLGALLPDADGLLGWPGLFGFSADATLYAKYHRTVTHSILGFAVVIVVSAAISRVWPERWLLPFLRTKHGGRLIVKPSWRRLIAFSAVAVFWHFIGDSVTAWGTLRILWPFSDFDAQLRRVNSLEPVLLALTVAAWGAQHFCLTRGLTKSAWAIAAAWLLLCAVYVWLRPHFGAPAFV